MNAPIGLKERIAQATSETEVIQLLTSGQTFNYASPRTKLNWKYTAQRRIRQLQQTVLVETSTNTLPISNKNKTIPNKNRRKK
jgi:hypothetical protein